MKELINRIVRNMDQKVGYRVMQSTLVNKNVLDAAARMEHDLK